MKLPPIRSLRTKLLLFSLLLVGIPGGIFAYITFRSADSALRRAVGRQLAEVAEDATDEIGEYLNNLRKTMRVWARRQVLRQAVAGNTDERASRALTSLTGGDLRYLDVLLADQGGHIVAASDPRLLGTSSADRAWFRTALGGQEFVNGPTQSPEQSATALEVAVPVYDAKDPRVVTGVLLGLYDWSRASEFTQRLESNLAALSMTVDLVILDDRGVVINGPEKGALAALAGKNLRAAGWVTARRRLPRRRGYRIEQQANLLVGYARFKEAEPHWTALALQPLQDVRAPLNRLQQLLALLLGGLVLGGLSIATVMAARMSQPLRELTQATQEIARIGETQHPVTVRSQDEIGQLAESFNRMASELRVAREDLLVASKFAFIGELAAGVAHEVRTPLGIMRSSAQLLGRSLPANRPESKELVDTIVDEVDRLDRVVARLLELARPHGPLLEPTQLKDVLGRALDFIDAQAREKALVIHRGFAAQQRPARCDPDQIYQVALNLLVNALQILPRGGEITVRTLPTQNGRVAFEVSDNGPGMPADIRDRIFAPFFTRREGGTGLGLALVQRVVQEHKGTVSVDSTVGQGTTFRVELPVAEGPI